MIIRKPYAFLIKYFKMIHFGLAFIMFLLGLTVNSLLGFYVEYYREGSFTNIYGAFDVKFTLWPYIFVIIIIGVIVAILFLLNEKKKPVTYYYFLIATLILVIVLQSRTYFELRELATRAEITPSQIMLMIDFLVINIVLVYGWMVALLMRGFGFRIKQFDFKKDLDELDISEADREEIEVDISIDKEDYKSIYNNIIRQLKYTFLENKVLFTFGAGALVFLLIFIFILYYIFGNRTFYQRQVFGTYGLKARVLNTVQFKENIDGILVNKGKFYMVVAVEFENKTDTNLQTNPNVFLETKGWHKVYQNANGMLDFIPSRGYASNYVPAKSRRIYNYIFELDEDYWNSGKKLKFAYSNRTSNSHKFRTVILNSSMLGEKRRQMVEYKKDENTGFSLLNASTFKIDSVNILDEPVKVVYNEGTDDEYYKYFEVEYYSTESLIEVKYKNTYDDRLYLDDDYDMIAAYFDIVEVDKISPSYKVLGQANLRYLGNHKGSYYYIADRNFYSANKLLFRNKLSSTYKTYVIRDLKNQKKY